MLFDDLVNGAEDRGTARVEHLDADAIAKVQERSS
jgi:hypothetical protein